MRKHFTVADVAQRLGPNRPLSRTRVIALDPVLKPRRSECGARLYSVARVDYFAGARTVAGVQ